MDTQKFDQAQEHYDKGDYRKSARLFLDAIEKGTPIGNGPAYHMAGNSFMRLKRYDDAAVVFEHALRDDTYQRRGAIEANLATAYIRTKDYDNAVAHFEAAIAIGDSDNAYKLYQGIAQAYMMQEKFEPAAIAYKHAAVDINNPAPGKSLLNLGLAMMAGGNPKGAIEAYQTALTSPDYENKGRALANMGIAQHALGLWEDCVRSLEKAKLQDNYTESELARDILADAQHRIEIEEQVAESDQFVEDDDIDDTADSMEEYVAESAPTFAPDAEPDQDGWAGDFDEDVYPDREDDLGSEEDVERFFSRSEADAMRMGRDEHLAGRGRFFGLKIALVIMLVVTALVGGAAALFFTGQGYPSAEATVNDLLTEYAGGRNIAQFWTQNTPESIEGKMVVIPLPEDFTIDEVNLGPEHSTVRVSIHTAEEETLVFTFGLVREGIGWKVNEVVMEGLDGPSELAGDGDDLYDDGFFDEEFLDDDFFDEMFDEDGFFNEEGFLDELDSLNGDSNADTETN
ncbi:MAG: tetratricopeptide repeat protein [Coriobacteriia bacterium]|nr:tetratricopeptide repeat protein [Coriobacteriia bacterium]